MKILLWPELSEDLKQMAESLCPDGMELQWLARGVPEDELVASVNESDCLFTQASGRVPLGVYAAAENLKLWQLLSAGYDFVDIDEARARKLAICTNGGANAIAVAEYAVMLMLATLKRLPARDAALRAGIALRDSADNRELGGRTVGLIGLGNIGREVARRLAPFNVRIVYFDVLRADDAVEKDLHVDFRSLEALLGESDVISLHAPLTPETKELINEKTLSLVKPTAILINTARGELVDENALVNALSEDRLWGAGLDVFAHEPPPADDPLLRSDLRIIATPHVAGPTWESFPRRLENAFANAARVGRGEAPLWLLPELRS